MSDKYLKNTIIISFVIAVLVPVILVVGKQATIGQGIGIGFGTFVMVFMFAALFGLAASFMVKKVETISDQEHQDDAQALAANPNYKSKIISQAPSFPKLVIRLVLGILLIGIVAVINIAFFALFTGKFPMLNQLIRVPIGHTIPIDWITIPKYELFGAITGAIEMLLFKNKINSLLKKI